MYEKCFTKVNGSSIYSAEDFCINIHSWKGITDCTLTRGKVSAESPATCCDCVKYYIIFNSLLEMVKKRKKKALIITPAHRKRITRFMCYIRTPTSHN